MDPPADARSGIWATDVSAVTFDQVFVWFAHAFDGPFTVVLILLAGLALMLWRAQRSGKLDMAQMFHDTEGRASGGKFAILGAWIISSWFLMAAMVSKLSDMVLIACMGIYLLFWSGAPIALELVRKWDGRLPWSKGPT